MSDPEYTVLYVDKRGPTVSFCLHDRCDRCERMSAACMTIVDTSAASESLTLCTQCMSDFLGRIVQEQFLRTPKPVPEKRVSPGDTSPTPPLLPEEHG